MVRSISQKALKKSSRIPAAIILTLLLIGGAAGTYAWTFRSYQQYQDAKNWIETPCVIVSSKVGVHQDDDSATYSVDITFEYEFKGIRYTSARYNLAPAGSSSGYESKKAIVDKYPPGTKTICYVNPKMPSMAVLFREFTPAMLLTLIPVIPALIGAGGLAFLIRSSKKPQPRTIYDMDAAYDADSSAISTVVPDTISRGPILLKPKESRTGKFIFAFIFSIIWDAVVLTIWLIMMKEKEFSWMLIFFASLFTIAGFVILVILAIQTISLTNPKVAITVNRSAVPLGGMMEMKWEIPSRASSLRRLAFSLEGIEEATYSSGKNTRTDRNVFLQIPIFETNEHSLMIRGNAEVRIPDSTMHTFKASHNKILWTLTVVGVFPHWFRMKEDYEITVLPLESN